MNANQTMTNETFSFLKNSSEFLNLLLDNINSCVLLLDKDMRLRAFNNALRTIFSNKENEDLIMVKCGEAIGCAYQIEEATDCGNTSQCCNCELREAGLLSYIKNVQIYKEHIIKPFFDKTHKKVDKHLQFSTRLFEFQDEKYIIMLIEDITKFYSIQIKE